MHFIQALKMACKSLWSNKLRSFLTMLGIIIGVVTVALLTSVASGVSTAVVSSIRSQSTLSIMMCTSEKMTYKNVYEVLENNQNEETADDYYDFSLVYSSKAVVSSDLSNLGSGEEIKDSLIFNKVIVSDEQYNKMTGSEKTIYDNMKSYLEKASPSATSVMAVNKNFADVYDVEFVGKFPSEAGEILVDRSFVDTYLGKEVENNQVINQTVSLGVTYYAELTLKFKIPVTAEIEAMVKAYMENIGYEIKNSQISGNSLIIDIDYFTTSNEFVIDRLTKGIKKPDNEEQYLVVPPYAQMLVDEESVVVREVYESDNVKNYKITGVIEGDSSMMMSNMTSDSSEEFSIFDLLMNSIKGTCYMILDDSILKPLGADEEFESLNDLPMNYAYMRFKTEDVMEDRVNDVTAAFMSQKYLMYAQDFMIISMNAVANIVDQIMSILTTMLTVISIVSLIVGGIGIMNIMLVAVTERTREIGIRKAIGAKRSAILVQFLVEALMLSIVGGLIGLGFSALGCLAIGNAMGISISMPMWVIGMSLGFCTLIGLIFGMFPAVKASRMQPIDALRRD